MNLQVRILYSGAMRVGSLTRARFDALNELGHDVVVIDQVPYLAAGGALLQKLQIHLSVGPGIRQYNRDIVALARSQPFDLVYVDQACYLAPATVRALAATGARVVQYTSDYFGYRRYSFRRLLAGIPDYDAHVVTNPRNIDEMRRRGAGPIVMARFGYDPALHHIAASITAREYKYDVTFIGHWEPATERLIAALREGGVRTHVWGPGWRRSRLDDRGSIQPVSGRAYVDVIGASRIALGILSKWNFNTSASRTYEIPAIGSLLLGERTPEHVESYIEGREAEFFDTADELVEKARRYLADEPLRQSVAAAGQRRCLTSGYSQTARMREILEGLASALTTDRIVH